MAGGWRERGKLLWAVSIKAAHLAGKMGISILHTAKVVTVPAGDDEKLVKEAEEVNERSHSKIQGVRGELWKPGRTL